MAKIVKRGSFLLNNVVGSGGASRGQLFNNKKAAIAAWESLYDTEVLQGNFGLEDNGYVQNYGRVFLIKEAVETPVDKEECECCHATIDVDKLAYELDHSDGNVYSMCPKCRKKHREWFEEEMG